jgi:Uma2 family endonuclease
MEVMTTAAPVISVEEYLSNVYEPDCDYVDGHLEERNLGELDHSWLQAALIGYFFNRRKEWNIVVLPEQRVQVKRARYRVPDVCVLLGPKPTEQILRKPPFIYIEILSPEDRMNRVEIRIADYLEMGVSYVWILDPQTRQAYVSTKAEGLREVKNGVLRTENPTIEVLLAEVFA